uniref:Uncharacterized protein n=1 Tax=Rhizophora mucronata TaxID=61149 RepID=A0A2P2PR62_RHIMU
MLLSLSFPEQARQAIFMAWTHACKVRVNNYTVVGLHSFVKAYEYLMSF